MNFLLFSIVITTVVICVIPLQVEAQKGWKTHIVENEFSFKYPTNWDLTERENRFTSIDASLKYEKGDTSASIIFESGLDTDDAINIDDNKLLSLLKKVLKSVYDDSSIFESGVDKYKINNQTAPYTIATFSKTNLFGYKHDYVVMAIAIKINDNLVIAQFISTEDDFDRLLKAAEKIFESVKPVNSPTA